MIKLLLTQHSNNNIENSLDRNFSDQKVERREEDIKRRKTHILPILNTWNFGIQ